MEFTKINNEDEGEEEMNVYIEDGYVFIETEFEHTHSFAFGKAELRKLISILTELEKEIFKP